MGKGTGRHVFLRRIDSIEPGSEHFNCQPRKDASVQVTFEISLLLFIFSFIIKHLLLCLYASLAEENDCFAKLNPNFAD